MPEGILPFSEEMLRTHVAETHAKTVQSEGAPPEAIIAARDFVKETWAGMETYLHDALDMGKSHDEIAQTLIDAYTQALQRDEQDEQIDIDENMLATQCDELRHMLGPVFEAYDPESQDMEQTQAAAKKIETIFNAFVERAYVAMLMDQQENDDTLATEAA